MTRLHHIVHVDDDPDIQLVTRMILQAIGGFAVTSFGSGVAMLEAIAELRPDLILLDMMMPDMDGPATLRELRKQPGAATIPVIFMTAQSPAQPTSYGLDGGVIGVLPKPFDPMALCDQITQIWMAQAVRRI